MNVIIFCALIWAICKLISSCSRNAKEKAAERERERIRAEQQRIREEQARAREWQREAARRQVEHDKAIAKMRKDAERKAREDAAKWEAQRKADAKRDAEIKKHDEMIATMTFRIQQAEHDILHVTQQMDEYMPLLWRLDERMQELDRQISIAQQMGKVDAVNDYLKEKDKVQRKIISLENNIHVAENKLAKAQFIKAQAEKKISA